MSVTVLCVHENREISRLHAETLEAEGYEVLCAHDGRQTLEILRVRQPDFAVMDTHLPRQDGFEILAEMRTFESLQQTPVLLVSDGYVTADLSERATALGAIGIEMGPIGADRLVSRVAEFVKPLPDRVGSLKRVPTTGTLREIPIPELLYALRIDRHDGVLLLDHGKKKKAVEFRDGWPVSVKSNSLSECLGGYLVREGRVPKQAFDESTKRMRAGEGLQGQILVAMDVLEEDEMVAALREHAREKFFEIFSWRDGQFAIRSKAHVQRGSSLGLEGHPFGLIVEGVRRTYSLKQIDRYLEAHRDAYLVAIASCAAELSEVGLTERELSWIGALDGSMTLAAVLGDEEWVRRLVFGLLTIEFLSIGCDAADLQNVGALISDRSTPADSAQDEAIRGELAELANRIRNKDHYQVLEVDRSAGDEEIRVAYACLAKRTHPDRFHGASSSVRQLAAQVFERVAEAHGTISTSDGRRAYAAELSRGKKLDAVEDEGRRALAAETEFQKGEAKLASRDYEGALLHFGKAMENFPSEGEYRSHYGWCLYLCHQDNDVMLGEALEHCREGLKLAKDREKPYLLLGRLYKAMGKAGAAKKMFSRAVQIKPQCVEAMRELRIMNMRREKTQGLGKVVLKRIFRR